MATQVVIEIRDYDGTTDNPGLRACFIELQLWERTLIPGLLEPERIADRYLGVMLGRIRASRGCILVAAMAAEVIGFIGVLGRQTPELDEPPEEYAYVCDLVVRAPYRGCGIGRQLLNRAEHFARDAGLEALRVGVLSGNQNAHRLYRTCGFEDYTVQLRKPLSR